MNREVSAVWSESGNPLFPSEQVEENSWVAESQGGDASVFNRLVLKWERTVYNMASRILQDKDEAAEATQEIFLQAFKNIRRFRRDSLFSTWIYRIALNQCLSRIRCRPPGTHFSLDDGNAVSRPAESLRVAGTQDGELIRAENRSRVQAALSFLPPDQRVVVELKFFQELTFEDIAGVLDIPLSTIKSRLYAGLEMLKVRLGARA